MAEDLTPAERLPTPAAAEPAASADSPLVESPPSQPNAEREPYLARFRFAYALLAVVLGIGIGAFVVLASDGGNGPSLAWSGWKPTGSDDLKTQQIASHVAGQYRLPSGRELVAVLPRKPPAIQPSGQAVQITHIVYAPSTSQQDISVYSANNSVEYFLCGIGARSGRCAIGEGTPTVARARLLHQESLELALYTFKYVHGVDSVVTLQPPRAGANPTYAVFFRKSDFHDLLKRPLVRTIQGAAPYSLGRFSQLRQDNVARIVSPHLYRFSYQQAPDGSALMVLQPPPA
jgi:hypothetical protein